MAFYEVSLGYVGLGATTVFRTAQQAAYDIEEFGKETGDIAKYGGLLNQQATFKYAASKGRLRDLQREVETLNAKATAAQDQLVGIVKQLEKLGVAGAGDYLKMAGSTAISFVFPVFGVLKFAGVDIFGGSGKKKKAAALMQQAETLATEIQYYSRRIHMLQQEGETLAKSVEEGERAVQVQLVALPRKEVTVHVAADPKKYGKGMVFIQKRDVDVSTTKYGREEFASQEELAQRTAGKMAPSGDRLPVGFQTIYSPVLESGRIVAKVPQVNTTLPGPVDRRVVYGGLLSGAEMDTLDIQNLSLTGAIIVGVLAYFLLDWKERK